MKKFIVIITVLFFTSSTYAQNALNKTDDAGRIASEKIIGKVKETSMNIKRVFLPTNMDPDDFAQKYDLSFLDESIRNLIESKQQDLVVRI